MPYGETWVVENGTQYDGILENGEVADDIEHLFTGQVFDKESKLYYYNARYYDATVGMFITPDPMMSGLNHYAYASCNPVMYSDPTGYSEDDDGDDDPAPDPEDEDVLNASEKGKKVTVQKDDTLNGIGKKHGASPEAMKNANPQLAGRISPTGKVSDYDYIEIGEEINVPGKEESKSDQSQANTDKPDNVDNDEHGGGNNVTGIKSFSDRIKDWRAKNRAEFDRRCEKWADDHREWSSRNCDNNIIENIIASIIDPEPRHPAIMTGTPPAVGIKGPVRLLTGPKPPKGLLTASKTALLKGNAVVVKDAVKNDPISFFAGIARGFGDGFAPPGAAFSIGSIPNLSGKTGYTIGFGIGFGFSSLSGLFK